MWNLEEYVVTFTTPSTKWDVDVNLEPVPTSQKQMNVDEKLKTKRLYHDLQELLYETNNPETEDRSKQPRIKQPETGITIALLSSPEDCLPILIQGGQSCPGSVHLVLSTSWLSVEPSDRDTKLKTVFLHKAISMYRGGGSYLDVFDPPRRVTYLMNYIDDELSLGEQLLDCPTSRAVFQNTHIDDIVRSRTLMAKCGIRVPESLVFCRGNHYDELGNELMNMQVMAIRDTPQDVVTEQVADFLRNIDVSKNQVHIVVKPVDDITDVSIHGGDEYDNICNRAVNLLTLSEVKNGVLIEKFYHSGKTAAGQDDLTFRVRVVACRGSCDRPIATSFICRVGYRNEPINSRNTTIQSIETTLRQWGLETREIVKIKNQLKMYSESLLQEIISQEDINKNDVIQTDMTAIDFILTNLESSCVPVCIGFKSCKSYDLTAESVAPLIEIMCEKSQRYTMWGKTIVVLSKGGPSKRFVWKVAKEDNVKIILIDRRSEDIPDIYKFIDYDLNDHTRDEEHAVNICKIIADSHIKMDGCCTIWEDCVPLCADICERLSLNGPGLNGAKIAKKKSLTQNVIRESRGRHINLPPVRIYAEKCIPIESEEDIDNAVISFPCIMKREFGAASVGVKLVQNIEDCKQYLNLMSKKLHHESVLPGLGISFGDSMLLMKYIQGQHHCVDLVMYKKRLVAGIVSDNGPMRKGHFPKTGGNLPTCLPEDKKAQLINAAYQCCQTIGLVSGVFNIDIVTSSTGPKLIEINARMGGFYARNWIRECYGVDLMRCVFMCACDVKPHIYNATPSGQFVGITCLQSLHADLWNRIDELQELHDSGEIRFNRIQSLTANDEVDTDIERPIFHIGVRGDDFNEAKKKLICICEKYGISQKDYNVNALTVFYQKDEIL